MTEHTDGLIRNILAITNKMHYELNKSPSHDLANELNCTYK